MDETNLQLSLIGIFVLIFVILGAIFAVNYTREHDLFKHDEEVQTNFTLKLSSLYLTKQIDNIDYILYENNAVVQEGTFQYGINTEYDSAMPDTNYTLTLDSQDYYYDVVTCDTACVVVAMKVSQPRMDVLEYPGFFRVIIYVEKGELRDTVFCLYENSDRLHMMDTVFYEVEKPRRLAQDYTKCYLPMSFFDLVRLWQEGIKIEYDSDLGEYNKEYKTTYDSWDQIKENIDTVKDIEVNLTDRFYSFDILYREKAIDFDDRDIVRFVLADMYHSNEIKASDVTFLKKYI